MKHSDKKQQQRRIGKSIKWIPGGFYRDIDGALWCCVGVASSHGAPYRLIRAFNGGGFHAIETVQTWAQECGFIENDNSIVSGPHPHPWAFLFSGTKEATP